MTIDSRLRSSAEDVRAEASRRAVKLEAPGAKRRAPWALVAAGATVVLLVVALAVAQTSAPGDVVSVDPPPRTQEPPVGMVEGRSEDAGVSYHIPDEGWIVINESLTPNLGDLPSPDRYRDTIIAFATFPAQPGSSTNVCSFKPQNALEELGPTDALVSVLELSPDSAIGFPDRRRATGFYAGAPERLYPYIGEANNDFCYDLANEGRSAPLFYREYAYNDRGRAFIVQVGIGGLATEQTKREVWQILDSLEYTPFAEPTS